ncbi:MAG: PQQ-binding-like beta-propeller repeat protein [Candidatus Bathyarchaeota archaeon]|nr:PQQ-binding-like beta-propeller repeat protein [Candidatus Bathyarchaeota archaeon]
MENIVKENINPKNKMTAAVVALLLILSMASALVLLPSSTAYSPPWTIPTSAYVTVTPNPIGVNQRCLIVVYTDRYSPTAGGAVGQVWEGFQLDITKPDGTTETIGPWTCSSAVASDFVSYTPDQIGNYTIVFSWPGGEVESSAATYDTPTIGDKFLGATSEPCSLVVTADPAPYWPETPLPDGYWTTPVNAQNRDWSQLVSNWLGGTWLTNNFQKAGTGPKSAHVLWTAPLCADSPSSPGYPGGIADAQWPAISNNINDYQSSFRNPIIMNGILYYNAPTTQQTAKYGYYAVDLYTGNQIWYKNGTDNGLDNPYSKTTPSHVSTAPSYAQQFYVLSCGQLYHYNSVNGDGVASFLWMQQQMATTFASSQSTWYMLDSTTGNVILTLTNVPRGTSATGEDGSLLIYQYDSEAGNFLCWNSSKAIYPGGATSSGAQVFRPALGAVIDAVNDTAWLNASTTWGRSFEPDLQTALKTPHSGYTMNVTDDSLKGLPGSMRILQDSRRVPKQIFGSQITSTYGSIGGSCTDDTIAIWLATINEHATEYSPWPNLDPCVNTNLGFTVTLDYNKEITVPLPGQNHTWSIATVDYDSGLFVLRCAQTGQLWAYDLATGSLKWGPTATPPPNEQFYYYSQRAAVYDGVLLVTGQYAGTMYAYDATSGQELWVYRASSAPYGFESNYGENMPLSVGAVCDGMVYVYSTEHSPTNPLWRQSYVRGISLDTGEEVWKLACFSQGLSLADGYLISASQYDNLIYCIGKGPSATTVSTPEVSIPLGAKVLIQGAVTDESPGAKGTPAVSEESMEAWMEYLYEQQPKPADATGVPVHLTAIDPNGNFQDIGTATSDANGNYGIMWTPPVPGIYHVTAAFEGSASYGPSEATTYLAIDEAAHAAVSSTVSSQSQPSIGQPAESSSSAPLQTTSPSPEQAIQPTSSSPTTTYIAIGAAVIAIVVILAAVFLFRRRK